MLTFIPKQKIMSFKTRIKIQADVAIVNANGYAESIHDLKPNLLDGQLKFFSSAALTLTHPTHQQNGRLKLWPNPALLSQYLNRAFHR